MKMSARYLTVVGVLTLSVLGGCLSGPGKSESVTENVRKSLDVAGFKDVTVTQDRDKGVVTLGGHVTTEGDKAQAEALTKPIAVGQVVAVQIAVIPIGGEADAKAINSDLDKGIEKNVDAALIESKFHDSVKYSVKNAVVTLSGEVETVGKRKAVETIASGVPNVKQVVNTVQLKDIKATSTK